MVGKLAVAWATPVDVATLGAQLEAYVETKATILILRFCIRHAQTGSPLARLPSELVENVVTHIQQSTFEGHKQGWDQAISCCLSDCAPIDHMDPEEYEIRLEKYLDCQEAFRAICALHVGFLERGAGAGAGNDQFDFEASMRNNDECVEAHEEILHDLLSKIGYYLMPEEVETNFAKCRKVFAQDFGLETYFSVFRQYRFTINGYQPAVWTISAYLVLPSTYSFMKANSGPLSVSFPFAMILDHVLLKEPSSEQRSRFHRAMNQLRLQPQDHTEQITETYPTSGTHLLTIEQRTWKDLESKGYRVLEYEEVQAASLEHTEWPKLMVLAPGTCTAGPDGS